MEFQKQTKHSVSFQLISNCLVATLAPNPGTVELDEFRKTIMAEVHEKCITKVILDFSGVPLMDSRDFAHIKKTISMLSILGTRVVISGLHPGVVSALIHFKINTNGLETSLNVSRAFDLLQSSTVVPFEEEEEEIIENESTIDLKSNEEDSNI